VDVLSGREVDREQRTESGTMAHCLEPGLELARIGLRARDEKVH